MAKNENLLYVRATAKAGKRVALREFDRAHPKPDGALEGEVFVHYGNGVQEVAETPGVLRALAEGLIEKVESGEAKKALADKEKATIEKSSGKGAGKAKNASTKTEKTPPGGTEESQKGDGTAPVDPNTPAT